MILEMILAPVLFVGIPVLLLYVYWSLSDD